MAEIALLTPTAPCHDLVSVRHPMSSSRGFPLFTGCSNPGSFAGNHPVYPPGAAGPLGRYPAMAEASGMDPVTKRNTRVSNRTISIFKQELKRMVTHSPLQADFAPRTWFPNRTGVFRSHPALRSTLITGSCGSGTWRFPSRPPANAAFEIPASGSWEIVVIGKKRNS